MTATSKAVIKSYFESGDTPTGSNFSDLIDSYQDYSPVLNYIATAASSAQAGYVITSDGAGNVTFAAIPTPTSFSNIYVSGKATVSAFNAATSEVSGAAIFGSTVNITGNTTIGGSASLNGNVTVSGALAAGRITDWHSFYVDTVSANTYDWVPTSPYAYTLQGIRRKTNAGDCNVDVRKNNVSLAVYSASAAVASAALSSTFAAGDNLTVVVTSVSSCTGLSVYAQFTRAL